MLFTYPEYLCLPTSPSYVVRSATLVLLRRLKARFPTAWGSSGHGSHIVGFHDRLQDTAREFKFFRVSTS